MKHLLQSTFLQVQLKTSIASKFFGAEDQYHPWGLGLILESLADSDCDMEKGMYYSLFIKP